MSDLPLVPEPNSPEEVTPSTKAERVPVGSVIGALILIALGGVCIAIGGGLVIDLITVAIVGLIAAAVALLVSAFKTS